MTAYNDHILSLSNPSFQEIRRIAWNSIEHIPQEERDKFFHSLNRGVDLLTSNELLCQYLWSYGNMHEAKIKTALEKIPVNIYNDDFTIIDWGCGQGLATICFFDFLNQRNIQNKTQKVILIEPSPLALKRAKLHVNAYLKDESKIETVNKYLNDVTQSNIHTNQSVTLHFFSNILDIPQIDLKKLAELVGQNLTGEHYFCCVGPLNSGSHRIDFFYDYFNSPPVLFKLEQSENTLQILAEDEHYKDFQRNYTLKLKVFKFERNKIYYIPIDYYPAVQFHAAYQLDGVKKVFKDYEPEKVNALYKYLSTFEVYTPFDIGASVYDDVEPVFAVLNNMITRGLPTKASPFIEDKFKDFGNRKVKDDLGAIVYDLPDANLNDLFLALHTIDPRWELTKDNYNCKILESDLEKEYIFSVAPKSLQQLLQPQRILHSITNSKNHYAQRVDFACEFPYSNNRFKGCVVELDGAAYHINPTADQQRDREINNSGWACQRIPETQINHIDYQKFENEYIDNIHKVYQREFTEDWTKALQLVLSPIAVARVQKTVIEALLTGRLKFEQDEWNILVQERDVPCAAISIEDLNQMFEHLFSLLAPSNEKASTKFPKIKLEIISTNEFVNSSLHLDIKPTTKASTRQKNKQYDMIIDIAMLRRSGIENISFSEFHCKNDCYFIIRSAHYCRSKRHIYTSDTIDYKSLVEKDKQGKYIDLPNEKRNLEYFMQLLFRKEEFRPGQLPILSRALQNKCVIGLLPTGGGKSLTYQLAAMLQPGVTIVVDPLRSLMKDQYDGLINAGIDTCTFINSTLTPQEKDEREKQLETSQLQFIFLSPERLCIYKFRERLKTMHDMNVYFAYGVIDEVHCVSEWGHDFRFSYLHLGRNLYNYVRAKNKRLTLFGLTATASFDVLADVERELSGNGAFLLDADTTVSESTNRLELQYKIEKVNVEFVADKNYDRNKNMDATLPGAVNIGDKWSIYSSKNEFLKDYIPAIPSLVNELHAEEHLNTILTNYNTLSEAGEKSPADLEKLCLNSDFGNDFYEEKKLFAHAGIVFCPHKDNSGISVNVNAATLNTYIPKIGTFMGSSNDDDSENTDLTSFENLELFRDNKLPLMVATKAFGMGIDKPNVRFTLNMNYSSSLESFVQEAGRAGRDRRMALSIIFLSDYKLTRINNKFPMSQSRFPMGIIKNRWFKGDDLYQILQFYNLSIDPQYIDILTPSHDMVKLRCEICNIRFAFNKCEVNCSQCDKGPCNGKCNFFDQCKLREIPHEAKGYQYIKDLEDILGKNNLLELIKKIEYQNADYETVMYFFNSNFKGSLIEKQTMHYLLSKSKTDIFFGDDAEIKTTNMVSDFLSVLLNTEENTEIVAFVSNRTLALYNDKKVFVEYLNRNQRIAGILKSNGETEQVRLQDIKILHEKSDIAKAIYRMCCISLIDDFTEDYTNKWYRIVAVRKKDGEHYKALQSFFERYYSKKRAEEEIQNVPEYKGENEIHKCLGYLTEFIYDKIAVKRKRAIDDMRSFCITGINHEKDWKEVNEKLKENIYYYFNSKYARSGYETENGEPFSLTDDTEEGKKSAFEIVSKYLRVVNDDVHGTSGSPKDNVKHLQGAVRLIRRSLTDNNAALSMLNTFCLSFLGTNNNEILKQELEESFMGSYIDFYNDNNDKQLFYDEIKKIMDKLQNIPMDEENIIKKMNDWILQCELEIHNNWLNNFKNKYIQ